MKYHVVIKWNCPKLGEQSLPCGATNIKGAREEMELIRLAWHRRGTNATDYIAFELWREDGKLMEYWHSYHGTGAMDKLNLNKYLPPEWPVSRDTKVTA